MEKGGSMIHNREPEEHSPPIRGSSQSLIIRGKMDEGSIPCNALEKFLRVNQIVKGFQRWIF